jgi:uncharacterized protein with HEPN domain
MPRVSPSIERTMHQRLRDVIESCEAIRPYTAGMDFVVYERDRLVRDGVERRLGIIGEALSRAADFDPDLRQQIPEFHRIVGLRNRVIHGYSVVDNEVIWDVVQNKLPTLEVSVATLLGDASRE